MTESALALSDSDPPNDAAEPAPTVAPLDAALQDQFCNIMRLGCSRCTAAAYLRASPEAVSETVRSVPQFAVELAKAEASCEVLALKQVSKALQEEDDWRAAVWLLERRDPDRYVARKPGQVTPEQAAEFLRQLTTI